MTPKWRRFAITASPLHRTAGSAAKRNGKLFDGHGIKEFFVRPFVDLKKFVKLPFVVISINPFFMDLSTKPRGLSRAWEAESIFSFQPPC